MKYPMVLVSSSMRVFFAALLLSVASSGVRAQDGASATTVADPAVPVDQLEWQLKPLTQDELAVEAEQWLLLLKAKAREISQGEIAQLQEAEGAPDAAALAQLGSEQSALADRLGAVLDQLEKKGGDVSVYQTYVDVVANPLADLAEPQDMAKIYETIRLTLEENWKGWAFAILRFVVVIVVFSALARIIASIVNKATARSKTMPTLLRGFVVITVRRIVFFVGLLIALIQVGVNVGPFLAVITAAGFVIGLALQGTLSNFASGLLILWKRPYDIGNAVEAGGVVGAVESMNLFSTTIKTFDNRVMIVPNNSIWNGVITNITGSPTRRVDMTFGIGYDDSIDEAQAILERIVTEHPLTLKDPAPVVKFNEFADSSMNFVVRPWSKTADYWTLYWDVHKRVKEEFDKAGISIPFPQRDVHLYQESK